MSPVVQFDDIVNSQRVFVADDVIDRFLVYVSQCRFPRLPLYSMVDNCGQTYLRKDPVYLLRVKRKLTRLVAMINAPITSSSVAMKLSYQNGEELLRTLK